jgi:hypothetical protein
LYSGGPHRWRRSYCWRRRKKRRKRRRKRRRRRRWRRKLGRARRACAAARACGRGGGRKRRCAGGGRAWLPKLFWSPRRGARRRLDEKGRPALRGMPLQRWLLRKLHQGGSFSWEGKEVLRRLPRRARWERP